MIVYGILFGAIYPKIMLWSSMGFYLVLYTLNNAMVVYGILFGDIYPKIMQWSSMEFYLVIYTLK